ncbi:MAG: hypothetical protein EZS28_004367 [Streblomastix strix]|uniref:Uncharacterized protein n=1 Tax=Streblomastix strix TaxID=222440 RepID=A0A5J4X034_9EUKA|nr:MAG: hypothetical protein EZS28_004367 [Streblomastix strix]
MKQSNIYPFSAQANASYSYGITWRQSMTKSKLWNRTGKNHVGYWDMAKVMNIALVFEKDIILQRLPLLTLKLLNGKLEDYDLNTYVGKLVIFWLQITSQVQLMVFYGSLELSATPVKLTVRTLNLPYGTSLVVSFNKYTISGFSGGII